MLDITNFREHPEQKDFMVFFFSQKDRAGFFEESLQRENLFFEKHIDEGLGGKIYYAVKRSDYRIATAINDESRIKFRKPFIADTSLRYFTLFLFFLMVGLAIVGMIVNSSDEVIK